MNKRILNSVVLTLFGFVSQLSFATGFVNLPAAGFSVTGGNTAYTLCNTTGNFGAGVSTKPTVSANNTCAVFPSVEVVSPVTGFSLVASATRPVVMNNTYTGNTDKTVGTVTEYVWRKQSGTIYECIYGAKIVASSVPYNASSSFNDYFEIKDFARGGFAGLSVDVAYATISTVSQPVFRVGRSYTAVQHRAYGYSSQPLTGLSSNPSINGLNSYSGTASLSQQLADIDANWVDFTTQVKYIDADLSTSAASGMFYVKTTCSADSPSQFVSDEAIRLRQTTTPFIEVKVRGFVPPGGSITPAHTDPY